jgi:hypothetical protein
MDLIYRKISKNENDSLLEKKLLSMAKGKKICVVSLFINLNYLEKLIDESKDWKLLTCSIMTT